MAQRSWVYVGGRANKKVPPLEKVAITMACEALIASYLKPAAMPTTIPKDHNYPIDVYGKWLGNKYRFLIRMKTVFENSTVPEFDWPVARLEYVAHDRFDLSWHRHTGEWRTVFEDIPLAEALRLIETEPYFRTF